jgi:hypothetical protein
MLSRPMKFKSECGYPFTTSDGATNARYRSIILPPEFNTLVCTLGSYPAQPGRPPSNRPSVVLARLIAYNIFVLTILSTCIEKVIQLIFNHREKTFTCPRLSAKLGKLNSVYLALLSAVTSITLYVTIISTSIVMKPKPS